jgi:hypothetical protein
MKIVRTGLERPSSQVLSGLFSRQIRYFERLGMVGEVARTSFVFDRNLAGIHRGKMKIILFAGYIAKDSRDGQRDGY